MRRSFAGVWTMSDTEKSEAYAKLAEAVAALEDLGLEIEDADVGMMQKSDSAPQSLEDLFSMTTAEEEPVLQLIASLGDDAPEQEHDDNGDGGNEAVEIKFGDEDVADEITEDSE